MPRYIHFEHYMDDAQKGIDFYEKVFGWKAEKFGDMAYWTIVSGEENTPGINGGFSQAAAPGGQRVVNTMGVEDIDGAIKRAEEAGASVLLPKQAIPGMAWIAYLTDPTGVVFGLFMEDQTAA